MSSSDLGVPPGSQTLTGQVLPRSLIDPLGARGLIDPVEPCGPNDPERSRKLFEQVWLFSWAFFRKLYDQFARIILGNFLGPLSELPG